MYVLNNESILNIIKLSNTILTLSKDENNLSLPFSFFYKGKTKLPFTKYNESFFRYLNNEKVTNENQLEKREYITNKNSENNLSTKKILNYRNKLDTLLILLKEKNEKINKKKSFEEEEIQKRAETPKTNNKKINKNKFINKNQDNKIKNINKCDRGLKKNIVIDLTKTNLNNEKNKLKHKDILKNNEININDLKKLNNKSKKKNNSNISINVSAMNKRSCTPQNERKKKKKIVPTLEFHIDLNALQKKNEEEK